MAILELDVAFGLDRFELSVELEVDEGGVALIGPTGAGKTTLLRLIAGLASPDRGSIRLGERTLFHMGEIDLPPEERNVGFAFQDYALFPHLTVIQNIAYGGTTERAERFVEEFGLTEVARAFPRTLSGGERQRVSLARALARECEVLLLDEPLAALDGETKARLRDRLAAELSERAVPTVIVTHDFGDAVALARRVALMDRGQIRRLIAGPDLELNADLEPGHSQNDVPHRYMGQ